MRLQVDKSRTQAGTYRTGPTGIYIICGIPQSESLGFHRSPTTRKGARTIGALPRMRFLKSADGIGGFVLSQPFK